jgi:hypothetical protein
MAAGSSADSSAKALSALLPAVEADEQTEPLAAAAAKGSAASSAASPLAESLVSRHDRAVAKRKPAAPKQNSKKARGWGVDDMVAKCLREHFKDWGPTLTDAMLHGGLTLRQRIRRDKQAYLDGDTSLTFGSSYWQTLTDMYTPGGHISQRLVPRDKDKDPIDARLERALLRYKQGSHDRSALEEWMATTDKVNNRCYCALLKTTSRLKPHGSSGSLALCLGAMRLTIRLQLHVANNREAGVVKPVFDETLVAAFNNDEEGARQAAGVLQAQPCAAPLGDQ